MVEHRQRVGRPRRLEALHRGGDLGVNLLLEALLQEVLLLEVLAEAREGILLLPGLDLLLGAVLGRVVGGRVDSQAIRHALDEGRPAAAARALDRLAAGRIDRQHVVAVHLDPREAVRQRLLGERSRVGLLLERHRDGPLVVLAEEDDRHVPDAGEVQGLVEVALGGGAVAEEDHDDGVVAPVLGGVGEADGVGDLGRDGDGDRQVVLVGGGPAAFQVAGEEEQHLLDRPSPVDHGRRFAEGRHHPVGGAEGEDAAHLGGFLALDRCEGADPPLTLEPHHPLVQAPPQEHGAVQSFQVSGGNVGFERGVEIAVAVQDGQVLDGERGLEDPSRHGGAWRRPYLTTESPAGSSPS